MESVKLLIHLALWLAALKESCYGYKEAVNRIKASPTTIELGVTEKLIVNCTVGDSKSSGLAKIMSLSITGSDYDSLGDFEDLASISPISDGKPVPSPSCQTCDKAVVSGQIDEDGETFLSLAWNHPTSENARVYRCVVSGLDDRAHVISSESSVGVVTERPRIDLNPLVDNLVQVQTNLSSVAEDMKHTMNNIDHLLQAQAKLGKDVQGTAHKVEELVSTVKEIKTSVHANKKLFQKSVDDLKESIASLLYEAIHNLNETTLTSLQESVYDLKETAASQQYEAIRYLNETTLSRLHEAQRFAAFHDLFEVSAKYNGHRYYMPKRHEASTFQAARRMCEDLHGYVAEIDDKPECEFVQKFAKTQVVFNLLMISGSDAEKEGKWVHQASGTAVKFADWYPGQPNGGSEDCLVLYDGFAWKMGDYSCSSLSDPNVGFLCEVPQPSQN